MPENRASSRPRSNTYGSGHQRLRRCRGGQTRRCSRLVPRRSERRVLCRRPGVPASLGGHQRRTRRAAHEDQGLAQDRGHMRIRAPVSPLHGPAPQRRCRARALSPAHLRKPRRSRDPGRAGLEELIHFFRDAQERTGPWRPERACGEGQEGAAPPYSGQ